MFQLFAFTQYCIKGSAQTPPAPPPPPPAHIHTHTHTHTRARARTHTHARMHARSRARTHVCTYANTHTRAHANTHTHTHVHGRTQTHTERQKEGAWEAKEDSIRKQHRNNERIKNWKQEVNIPASMFHGGMFVVLYLCLKITCVCACVFMPQNYVNITSMRNPLHHTSGEVCKSGSRTIAYWSADTAVLFCFVFFEWKRVQSSPVNSSPVNSCPVISFHFKSSPVHSVQVQFTEDFIQSIQVQSTQFNSSTVQTSFSQFKSGRLKSSHVDSSPAKSIQVRSSPVHSSQSK